MSKVRIGIQQSKKGNVGPSLAEDMDSWPSNAVLSLDQNLLSAVYYVGRSENVTVRRDQNPGSQ